MNLFINWLIIGCSMQFDKTIGGENPQLKLSPKIRQPQPRAYKAGDYVIGGIFPVHMDAYKDTSVLTPCARFNEIGLVWVESMIYATESISNSEHLPNITLGYDIRDDCDKLFRATEIALDFVSTPERPFLYAPTNDPQFMPPANETCTPVGQVPDDNSDRMTEQSVVAMVGPASSDTAISTAHIFSAVGLAQISYSATSRILSDRFEYTSFFRTIPSDTYQVKAMVDIMVYFNWTYISLFGSDNSYGQLGMSSLEYEASKRNIDIALKKTFSYKDIRQIVTHLTGYIKNNPIVNRSNVLVIFAESNHAYALIKEFQNHNFTLKTFFFTESWTSSNGILRLPSSIIKGSLGMSPFSRKNDDFSHFFKTQTVEESSQRNPWFSELVQLKKSKYSQNEKSRKRNGRLVKEHKNREPIPFANQTLEQLFGIDSRSLTITAYVRDAVYVIVHALRKLLCKDNICMKRCISNEEMMRAVVDTEFQGATGKVRFDKHGDALGSFTILNIQKSENGRLQFRDVGQWNRSFLELKTEDIVWKGGKIVTSRCSDDCRPGYRKLFGSDNDCWACVRCEKGHFSNTTNMEHCESCISVFGLGWNSNPAQTSCQPLPQNYLSWNESLSTGLLTTSGIFSLLNLIALSLFLKFRNSYVIKGSNRKLTYVLFGILFSCFLSPVVYIGHPNQLMCVIQPTYTTLVLTSLMMVILFKTYHILVIFELPPTTLVNIHADRKLRDRRHFFCLLAFEVFVFGVMCITTYTIPPRVTFHYSDGDSVFVDCGHNWGYLNCVALSIFGTLTIVSVYMAYRVRKLPENFNEAHQISSAVFILFLVWLVTLIAISAPQAQAPKKTAYFCISVQVKALVVLLFMILPKLKVVLCNPAKDTSEAIKLQTIAYVMKEQSKPRKDSTSTISIISNLNL